jgi:hypothetical protein
VAQTLDAAGEAMGFAGLSLKINHWSEQPASRKDQVQVVQ